MTEELFNMLEQNISENSKIESNDIYLFKGEKSKGPFSRKSIKIWTDEEDKKLIEIAMINNEKSWKNISSYFKNKTGVQCRSRYKRIKPGIKRGRWTIDEDNYLLELIKIYNNNWSSLAKIIKNRTAQQIRNRYINILNPNINKTKLTEDDDVIIFNLYLKFGSSWKDIQKKAFKNSTPDAIKNRFYSYIKKNNFSASFLKPAFIYNQFRDIIQFNNEIKFESLISLILDFFDQSIDYFIKDYNYFENIKLIQNDNSQLVNLFNSD